MTELRYTTRRDLPECRLRAAAWFNEKWGIPAEAYPECMDDYLSGGTEYGWYLCPDGERIAGTLLSLATEELRGRGISLIYLLTD